MPFILVDAMGRKMVFIMFCINITFMSAEDVAAMIEKLLNPVVRQMNIPLAAEVLIMLSNG